jgi:hypothetical protein
VEMVTRSAGVINMDLIEALLSENNNEALMVDLNEIRVSDGRITFEEYEIIRDLVELRLWKLTNLLMNDRGFQIPQKVMALLSPEEKIMVIRIKEAVLLCREALIPEPLPKDQAKLGDF